MSKNNFESSLAELDLIVKRLEGGELTLDESIEAFEKAMSLVKACNDKLEQAEQRIRILTEAKDGTLTDAPFDSNDAT